MTLAYRIQLASMEKAVRSVSIFWGVRRVRISEFWPVSFTNQTWQWNMSYYYYIIIIIINILALLSIIALLWLLWDYCYLQMIFPSKLRFTWIFHCRVWLPKGIHRDSIRSLGAKKPIRYGQEIGTATRLRSFCRNIHCVAQLGFFHLQHALRNDSCHCHVNGIGWMLLVLLQHVEHQHLFSLHPPEHSSGPATSQRKRRGSGHGGHHFDSACTTRSHVVLLNTHSVDPLQKFMVPGTKVHILCSITTVLAYGWYQHFYVLIPSKGYQFLFVAILADGKAMGTTLSPLVSQLILSSSKTKLWTQNEELVELTKLYIDQFTICLPSTYWFG